MPVETDTSGGPKGLEEKLILKDPRSPRKTLLHLTDWPRIEHEEEIHSLTREGGYTWAGLQVSLPASVPCGNKR